MTKNFLLLLAICSALILSLNSCDKDEDEDGTNSVAKITVNESGTAKSGVTVYMFSRANNSVGLIKPMLASQEVVTNSDGVATFEVQDIDFGTDEKQTTLYFCVFNGDNVIGKTAMTIKKGETNSATIDM